MKKSPPTSRAGTETPWISVRPEVQRRVRQHVVLNLAAQLELALDALLLDGRLLMVLDVRGHLVERQRELARLRPSRRTGTRAP